MNNIPQLPIYVGNTPDTVNFRLEDVQEKLNYLNMYKSPGPDLLHPRVLRTLDDMDGCGPFNHTFSKSAETGIIHEDWKSTNVTAIHKKCSIQEPGNYRLILLASHQ